MTSNGQYGSLAAQEVDGLLSQHERYSTEDEEVRLRRSSFMQNKALMMDSMLPVS